MKLPLITSSPTGLAYVFLGMMLLVLIACGEETPPAASPEPTVTTVPATPVAAPTPTSMPAPTPTTTPRRAPTATAVPTDTPAPTDTPVPTDTPEPTPTPAPTATPTPEHSLPPAERERASLVALYEATDGDNWANNAGWLNDVPVGEWHGVTVNGDGRVTQLRLRENNLAGHIPSSLGRLAALTLLDLQVNELTGMIPRELGNLSRLEGLDLDRNQLAGQIPAELANLSGLQTLDLDFNQLEGPMPAWLGNLTNLWFLSLGENPMDGPIPPELGNLTNLRILGLVDAHLHGNIPVELANLTNLERVYLGGNDLEGCVPAVLRNVPENDLDSLSLPDCTAPPELSAIQLGKLFDEIIRKTEQREAFSEIKESNVGFSALEDMKKLRSEFVASETEAELYYALVKLSNARRDVHLRISPVESGLPLPEQGPCISTPIHVLPDLSDIHNPTFFVAAVGEEVTSPYHGDVIVGVNGRSIEEYINEFTFWIRHSTLHGLYWRMAYELPKQVSNVPPSLYSERLNLNLVGPSGQRYDVSLPYSSDCYRLGSFVRHPGFVEVMRRENFNVLLDRSQQILLLQWLDFEYSLIQDIVDLMEYSEEEGLLDYNVIVDVTLSGGGSRGAYAIQRLVDQPFRTTFGNVRLSDLGKARIQRYANREPVANAPDIFGLNLSRSWLYDWARTDASEAIRRGDEYTPPVPFKLAHLPKDSDGILQPAPVHFSGPVAIINGGVWGGSHLDQFVAMLVDNDLAVLVGMPTGGFSNTWEGDEVLRFPFTGRPVVSFQWSIGHTIRPNGEILEGNPAQPDIYIPLTRHNFQEYHQTLLDTAIAVLDP